MCSYTTTDVNMEKVFFARDNRTDFSERILSWLFIYICRRVAVV